MYDLAFVARTYPLILSLSIPKRTSSPLNRTPPDAAAAVAATSLKHMLCAQDALLGPWLPGRELLEDELRTFAGGGCFLSCLLGWLQRFPPAWPVFAAAISADACTHPPFLRPPHLLQLQPPLPYSPATHPILPPTPAPNPNPTGDRGGPQQHPWEAGLSFTAGFWGQTDTLLAGAGDGTDDDDDAVEAGADALAAALAPNTAPTHGGGSAHDGGHAPLEAPWLRSSKGGIRPGGSSANAAANASSGSSGAAATAVLRRQAADHVRVHRRFMPLPQPYGLAPALLEVQLWLLGKLLAVVPTSAQIQVLEVGFGWALCMG